MDSGVSARRVAARWLEARPAGELAGVTTHVTLRNQKGLPPDESRASRLPGESPHSTRDQAAPQPPATNPAGKEKHPPTPTGLQGPALSGSGDRVPVRSPGVPGEQYGHPFKGPNPGQRRVGDFYLERFPNTGGGLGRPSPSNPLSRHPDTERVDALPGAELDAGRVENNPGSARVIPSGYGYANRDEAETSAVRVAARLNDILRGLDPGVAKRSKPIKAELKTDRSGLRRYRVKGSSDSYLVTLSSEGDGPWSERDLRVSCTCEFWRWQGPEHWARAGGYLHGKPGGTAAPPDARDPDRKNRVCKHVAAVLAQLKAP